MPKNNVNDIVIDGFRAEVSWRSAEGEHHGDVQVATINQHSKAVLPGPVKENAFEAGEILDGWHVTLDREGCNRLIRSVREARDAAFGRDA